MKERHRIAIALGLIGFVSACAPSFTVQPAGEQHYAPTEAVEVVSAEPQRRYVIVATFAGKEEGRCASDKPYCSLHAQAERIGAHAIWIQKRDTVVYPGEWITLQGQLTQLRGFTIERIEGVLIRYTD